MPRSLTKVWVFASNSDPNRRYQTLQFSDGAISCECPGWTRRAVRSCRHTRSVELGTADSECVTFREYPEAKAFPAVPQHQPRKDDSNAKTKDGTTDTNVGKFKRRIV